MCCYQKKKGGGLATGPAREGHARASAKQRKDDAREAEEEARRLMGAGKFTKAGGEVLRGLTLWPESPSLLALYGDLLSEGGMHDAAQNFFDRAQALAKEQAGADQGQHETEEPQEEEERRSMTPNVLFCPDCAEANDAECVICSCGSNLRRTESGVTEPRGLTADARDERAEQKEDVRRSSVESVSSAYSMVFEEDKASRKPPASERSGGASSKQDGSETSEKRKEEEEEDGEGNGAGLPDELEMVLPEISGIMVTEGEGGRRLSIAMSVQSDIDGEFDETAGEHRRGSIAMSVQSEPADDDKGDGGEEAGTALKDDERETTKDVGEQDAPVVEPARKDIDAGKAPRDSGSPRWLMPASSHRKLLLPLLPNSTEPPPSSAAEHEKRRKAKADVEKEGGKTTSQAEEQQLGAEREAQSTEIHRQDDVRPEQAAGERRKLRWGLTPRETEMVGMGSLVSRWGDVWSGKMQLGPAEGESWLEDSSRILEETRLLMGSMEERQGRKAAMKSLFSRALTSLMDLVEHTIPGFLGEISQLELPAAQEHTARPPSAHGKPAWKEGNSARRNGSGGQYRAAGLPTRMSRQALLESIAAESAEIEAKQQQSVRRGYSVDEVVDRSWPSPSDHNGRQTSLSLHSRRPQGSFSGNTTPRPPSVPTTPRRTESSAPSKQRAQGSEVGSTLLPRQSTYVRGYRHSPGPSPPVAPRSSLQPRPSSAVRPVRPQSAHVSSSATRRKLSPSLAAEEEEAQDPAVEKLM